MSGGENLGRLGRYIRATVADLCRPAREVFRFRQGLDLIAAQLSDPGLAGRVRTATGVVEARLADHPQAWPYAVLAAPASLAVAVAGAQLPPAPPAWEAHDGWWYGPAASPNAKQPDQPENPRCCHVAVGVNQEGVLLLDLGRAPAVIEVSGPRPQAVFGLICGIAAQLATGLAPTGRPDVVITDGVHPGFTGPALSDALDLLERRSSQPRPESGPVILVCGTIDRRQAARIARLVDGFESLRVLTAGPYPGIRWRLPLTDSGRIVAPDLGLEGDAAPLEQGVAQALRLHPEIATQGRRRTELRTNPKSAPLVTSQQTAL